MMVELPQPHPGLGCFAQMMQMCMAVVAQWLPAHVLLFLFNYGHCLGNIYYQLSLRDCAQVVLPALQLMDLLMDRHNLHSRRPAPTYSKSRVSSVVWLMRSSPPSTLLDVPMCDCLKVRLDIAVWLM